MRAITGWRDTVRGRLVALIAVAAIPVFAMASVMAWQNYRLVLGKATQDVGLLRAAAMSRQAVILEDAGQMLDAIAEGATVSARNDLACQAWLGGMLAAHGRDYAGLLLLDAGGHPGCDAAPGPAADRLLAGLRVDPAALSRAARTDGLAFAPIQDSVAGGAPVLPVLRVIREASGGARGFVIAGLRLDALFGRANPGDRPRGIWLVEDTGRLVAAEAAGGMPPPAPAAIAALLARDTVLRGRASDGTPFVYASARLAQGPRVIIGYRAAGIPHRARLTLAIRLLALVLLLLAGLLAMALWANAALVAPLKRLGAQVRRWRAIGVFEPVNLGAVPREVRELSRSFADATATLGSREAELRAALRQQELLMQEIHHRVKNNLQIVASLLNLQAARIRQPAARAEFQSARDRVRALATLHRHLYAQGTLHTINMRSFLTELCGQLFQAMGEREGQRIRLEIEASELQMSSDQAVPLALIVTEAVSNAIRYAFPDGRCGHIAVRLTATPDEAELVVQDDGVGIPAGRVETEAGLRDGLGLRLIRGFARQLGAMLRVEEGLGTRYVVRLRLHREHDASDPLGEAHPGDERPGAPSLDPAKG